MSLTTKYLLIGGGLASAEAAKIIRQQDPAGSITLIGDEAHPPYNRPPLTKEFLTGAKTRGQILIEPGNFYNEQHIDLRSSSRVDSLDPANHRITLADGDIIEFERALLATGGQPIPLDVPGAKLPGVHYLRTLVDAESIAADARAAKSAVIIGAGFIGLEAAATLTRMRLKVTVIETQKQIWPRFAPLEPAQLVQNYLSERGIEFCLHDTVSAIHGTDRAQSVATRSGREFPCDLVCVGIGIRPRVELADRAGLRVENGIVVNEYLQSSHPDIYAAGDVANYPDPVFGKRRRVEHWGHAEYTGQLAGLNMTGTRQKYDLLTYVWTDLFDLHFEFAGDESDYDEALARGRWTKPGYFIFYLRNHRLQAYLAVNAEQTLFPILRKLIRSRKDLTGRQEMLTDPDFDLRQLL